MREALRLILGDEGEKRIKMGLAKDGSGVGGRFIPFVLSLVRVTDLVYFFPAALCALQAKKAEDASVHPVSKRMDALVP